MKDSTTAELLDELLDRTVRAFKDCPCKFGEDLLGHIIALRAMVAEGSKYGS